jgi:hypothetical protein
MPESDIEVIVAALWDYQDARRADAMYGSDFDRVECELRASFVEWLKGRDG